MAVKVSDLLLKAMGELSYEPIGRRVRAYAGGTTVLDSLRALVLWEPGRPVPGYAVPAEDVIAELVAAPARREPPPSYPTRIGPGMTIYDPRTPFAFHTAPGRELTVRCPDGDRAGAAFALDDPELAGYVAVDFDAFDWTEEDEPVVAHPRDPFSSIQYRRSGRHVRIEHEGRLLAESTAAMLLFEASHVLPVRYYLPPADVRVELRRSARRSVCPYKGQAEYWSASVGDTELRDIAWSYPDPLPEAQPIRGRIAFFDEKVDVVVDGVRRSRPTTPWS